MPPDAKPPKELVGNLQYAEEKESTALPSQWIIARGRSLRRKKQFIDKQRLSESMNLSGGESDTEGRPLSPSGHIVLFFKIGERWPDLAWALFDGVQSDSETVRMIKDIQLKNSSSLDEQIRNLMKRWWKEVDTAATVEELHRVLQLINIPVIQEVADPTKSTTKRNGKSLEVGEIAENDPSVHRLSRELQSRSLCTSPVEPPSVELDHLEMEFRDSVDKLARTSTRKTKRLRSRDLAQAEAQSPRTTHDEGEGVGDSGDEKHKPAVPDQDSPESEFCHESVV